MTHLVSGYSDSHTAFHIRMLFQERYMRTCHHREPPPRCPIKGNLPRERAENPLHTTGQPCWKAALLKAFPGLLSPPISSKPFGDPGLL